MSSTRESSPSRVVDLQDVSETVPSDSPSPTTTALDMVELPVDLTVYEADAVFRACYKFTDRAYLLLRRASPHRLIVEVRGRSDRARVTDLAGALANELIDQQLRVTLERETRAVRELIVAQAFAEARLPDHHAA